MLARSTFGSVRLNYAFTTAWLSPTALNADIFVGAQHEAYELPQKWWTVAFRKAVSDTGHTVLVLQPWHAPVPLMRSWCLVRLCRLPASMRGFGGVESHARCSGRSSVRLTAVRSWTLRWRMRRPRLFKIRWCVAFLAVQARTG
jgi:hypothetical protein